jgi:hypothetical protein
MHCSSMRPARGDIPPDWQSDGVFSRPTISRAIFEILHCPCEAAPARSRPPIHVHTRALVDNSATDMVPLGEGKRSAARADFSPSLPPVSPRTAALHKLYCPHAPTHERPPQSNCKPSHHNHATSKHSGYRKHAVSMDHVTIAKHTTYGNSACLVRA